VAPAGPGLQLSITFQPTRPVGWGDATPSGVPYRGATLTIALHGAGNVISAFKLDGTTTTADSIPTSRTGAHTVDITLTGGRPTPATGTILSDVNSNKCVDANANSGANGTVIQMWDCNSTTAQTWTRQSDGTIRVNGACLDVNGASTANGALVQLWSCNGGGNQQWNVVNGTLVNPASGKCLDDPGFNANDGTQLDIWTYNNGANQHWAIP